MQQQQAQKKPSKTMQSDKVNKKQQIMAKFKAKQKNFISANNIQLTPQSQQQSICCNICKLQSKQAPLIYCTYARKSNFYTLAKYQSFYDKSIQELNQNKSQEYLKKSQIQKKKLKQKQGTFIYSTCGHALHYQCFKKYFLEKLSTKYYYSCPTCKTLCNIFIDLPQKNEHSPLVNQQTFPILKENKQIYEMLIQKNLNKFSIINTFQNHLMTLNLAYSEPENKIDYSYHNMLLIQNQKSICRAVHYTEVKGIRNFLKNAANIYRCVWNISKRGAAFYQDKQKQNFLKHRKHIITQILYELKQNKFPKQEYFKHIQIENPQDLFIWSMVIMCLYFLQQQNYLTNILWLANKIRNWISQDRILYFGRKLLALIIILIGVDESLLSPLQTQRILDQKSQLQIYFKLFPFLENKIQNINKIEQIQLNFHQTNLPNSLYQFKMIYSCYKCMQCQTYPKKQSSELCICLLCGWIGCSIICMEKNINLKKKNKGALNQHSLTMHQGHSVFIGVGSVKVYFVSFPQNYMHITLYQDNMGRDFSQKQHNKWQMYTLNISYFNEIKKIIVEDNIGQYINMVSQKEGNMYRQAIF